MQNLRKIQLEMTELFKFEEGQIKKLETKTNNWLCSSRLSSPNLGLDRFGWVLSWGWATV